MPARYLDADAAQVAYLRRILARAEDAEELPIARMRYLSFVWELAHEERPLVGVLRRDAQRVWERRVRPLLGIRWGKLPEKLGAALEAWPGTVAREELVRTEPRHARMFADDLSTRLARGDDLLFQYPYDDFGSTHVRWLEMAARDPDVTAIWHTLYRVGHPAPVIEALVEAHAQGKDVTAVIEVDARGDEAANLWHAERLARAGVRVVESHGGEDGQKVHAKLALVERRDGHDECQIGSGNYHAQTATCYEDVALFSARSDLTNAVRHCFAALADEETADSDSDELLTTQRGRMRRRLLEELGWVRAGARAGERSVVRMKVNALTDPELIDACYAASEAGVRLQLVVRGRCALLPEVPGLSEHVHVRSVVGPILEHSRILSFACGRERHVWLGSADLTTNKLDQRVETLVRVQEERMAMQLSDVVLPAYFSDVPNAWHLTASGLYARIKTTAPHKGKRPSARFDVQQYCAEELAWNQRR